MIWIDIVDEWVYLDWRMPRPNKKHHKVPAVYLRGFTDDIGKIWVADRDFKVYPQQPEDFLTENDYYTVRFPNGGGTLAIEKEYLGGIEGKYGELFRKVLSEKKEITSDDKAILSVFIASMIERQPMSRNSLARFVKDLKEKVEHLKQIPVEKRKNFAMLPTNGSSFSADEFLEMTKDIGSFHTSLIPDTVEGIAPIIYQMNWVFMVRDENSKPFITSDNPCVMLNPELENHYGRGHIYSSPGLAQNSVEITMPLSSDIAVLCGWESRVDCLYFPADPTLVDEINKRSARHAQVLIGKDKDMLTEISNRVKKNLEINSKSKITASQL